MSRFRSVLLALGVVTLMAAGGAAYFTHQTLEQDDENRRLAAAERVSAVNDYFERARAVALLASRESAFVDFYRASGTREERIERGGRLMERVNAAVAYVGQLYPDSIGETCFIDRSGADNANVIAGKVIAPHHLSQDKTQKPFFYPTLQAPVGDVYQTVPYRSPYSHAWVISQSTLIDTGAAVSPAMLHFEVTIASFAAVLASKTSGEQVRLVDVRTGAVVLNSQIPQQVGAPLGEPRNKSFEWVRTAKSGTTRSTNGMRHAMRLVTSGDGNVNRWAVVVSTPEQSGIWAKPTAPGPIALGLVLGILALGLSVAGYVRNGRDINQAARRDDLTLLPNRLAFRERLTELLHDGRACAVLLLDLDRFKEINDTLGHHAGDDLLCEIGRRLQASLRGQAQGAARLGGDEFVVVARGVTTVEDALRLAGRIAKQLERPLRVEGVPIRMSASIGVALAPEHANEYGALLRCADVAMYAAKEKRSGPVVYDASLDMHSPQRLGLNAQLAQAVANDELEVYYQPIYDIAKRRVTRLEALVRWQHPEFGLVGPDDFIPRAEETGFIRVITRAVLWKSLDQLGEWLRCGFEVSLNVNVSAAELNDESFASEVQALLAALAVPPERLTLELTESALLIDSTTSDFNLRTLRSSGVGVAIDDFGTGHSSFALLRMCPATQLKIDQSVVSNMVNSSTDAYIVQSMIQLGANLGIAVIAEGVEDEETFRLLEVLGCGEVQGFVLSPPQPSEHVAQWLPTKAELAATLP